MKSWKKTSQSEPHPSPHRRDPWKSWKKPHNLRTIPWTSGNAGKNLTICGPSPGPPEILEKTSQSADHPRDLRKSWKKTSQYYGFACWLVVGCCSDKLCRGPLWGQLFSLFEDSQPYRLILTKQLSRMNSLEGRGQIA